MENKCRKSIIIVDGTSYLYRSYYAFPSFFNSSGQPSGAIYGVLNMIRSLFLQYNPYTMTIVFDSPKKNFRNKLYKDYKINRFSMPNDLQVQVNPLYTTIKNLGIPIVVQSKVEADDVIGTLSKLAEKQSYSVLISSNDKDMAQLVNDNISIIDHFKRCILKPVDIKKKFGVKPECMNHYLALTGDVSDNIPGVDGIGKKTASILLKNFGTIQNIYKNLNNIQLLPLRGKEAIKKKLKKNQKNAFLSLKLTTIKTDVNLKNNMTVRPLKNPKVDLLKTFFNHYEFVYLYKLFSKNNWFIKKLENKKNPQKYYYKKHSLNNYFNYLILDEKVFFSWFNKFKKTNIFSFFFDINFVDDGKFIVNGITLSTKKEKFTYLIFKNNRLNIISNLNMYIALENLKLIFENPKIYKVTENLKLQYLILSSLNIFLCNKYFDTMLELYIFKNKKLSYEKNNLFFIENVLNYLKKNNILENSQENFYFLNQKNSSVTSLERIKKLIKKSHFILQTHNNLFPIIKKNKIIFYLYKKIDLPLVKSIFKMESKGVLVNCNLLETMSVKITNKLISLRKKAYILTGKEFNLSSTKQVQEILFKKKKLVLKNNKKKSTNKKILRHLSKLDPLPKIILRYRSLKKLQSTYIDKLPKMVRKKSNRIHTSYYQTITNTGRLSSKNPNLQNIPTNKKKEKNVRLAFIAPKNFIIMSADYSQIELRIIAHLSNDKALIHAFQTGKDVHSITASELFNVHVNLVTFEQRKIAKTINFSVIYGISAFGLSQKLNIEIIAAERYINLYFQKYHGIYKYIEKIKLFAIKKGYVKTIDNRKLYIKNIQSSNKNHQRAAERVAVNAPIQGTAADIIKKAMIHLSRDLETYFYKQANMIMQVHDELVFEIRKEKCFFISDHIRNIMETCTSLNIPLKVNIKVGKNWSVIA